MGAAIGAAMGAGACTESGPGGGPKTGPWLVAAIGGGCVAGASNEDWRGGRSHGCGAIFRTLIKFCGLAVAWIVGGGDLTASTGGGDASCLTTG